MEEYFVVSAVGILVCAALVSRKKKSVLDWALAGVSLFVGVFLLADLWRFGLANKPFWTVVVTLLFTGGVAFAVRQHFRRRRNRHDNQPTIHIHNHPPN
jgi:uncharacterized membrane protein YgdD (TMEM256/DUF423 family)